ncbi:MAG: Slp family lipoprotein [Nitrospiraceae bacterium]
MPQIVFIVPLLTELLILASCGESAYQARRTPVHIDVPSELQQRIDTSVAFGDLYAAPANYVGRMVKIDGIVIRTKRTTDQTELEILQLPTKPAGPPTTERLRSEGRFLAVREALLDPASVPAGTPITVIGVVKGSTMRPLDESEYTYPVVDIRHLIDWNVVLSRVPVDAEWVALEKQYQTHGLQTVYFGPDSIRRDGNLVKMVTLVDWKWMQGNRSPSRFSSTKVKKQFDCAGKRLRLLVITDYYGPMGTGTRVAETLFDSEGDWNPVEPEGINHALWEVACGKS